MANVRFLINDIGRTMAVLRPNWVHLSLPDLATKIRFLWEEHHMLDEEAVALRKRETEIEQRMRELASEIDLIRHHMKTLTPTTHQDTSVVLQLIKEDAQYLAVLAGTDEEMIRSIIAMVESVQAVYCQFDIKSRC